MAGKRLFLGGSSSLPCAGGPLPPPCSVAPPPTQSGREIPAADSCAPAVDAQPPLGSDAAPLGQVILEREMNFRISGDRLIVNPDPPNPQSILPHLVPVCHSIPLNPSTRQKTSLPTRSPHKDTARNKAQSTPNHAPLPTLPSHHPNLSRVAPGAHDAFEAGGAGADPDKLTRGEVGELRFPARIHPGGVPRGRVVGGARGGLQFVHAGASRGFVAGHDRAREFSVAQSQIRRRRRGRGNLSVVLTELGSQRGIKNRELLAPHLTRVNPH